ncbi:hypothetical protein FACS1894170_08890 [Planctomycetales bacterium]|nr:hypothetical protein FACS1894170_08890 [Planctomycetales bacterium]
MPQLLAAAKMRRILLEMGLKNAVFESGDGRTFEGETMTKLCKTLAGLEESILALETRGISLRDLSLRQDPVTAKAPVYHVYYDKAEHWFKDLDELRAFREKVEQESGKEVAVDDTVKNSDSAETVDDAPRLFIVELHEVRTLNKNLADLREQGFEIDSLMPQERTGKDTSRYYLKRGDQSHGLDDLRQLLTAVRSGGEKSMQVTRFKGLGEMNAEELRETTLHPANRTLIQVTMDDASAADDLFRILMGDKVEPRREFIEKHALEVKNLDV